MLARSDTASHTSLDDNLENDINGSFWIVEFNEPLAFDDIAVPLSLLELSEKQKYDPFFQLILATYASDQNSGLCEGYNKRLRH